MCRLAYFGRHFDALPAWLLQLEKSFGGDGTGFATQGVMFKAVDMTAEQSYDKIKTVKAPVLWHTRKCSSGRKVDELCHPFPCDGGFLVHNGHWYEGDMAARAMSDIGEITDELSDTAFFARLVDSLGFASAVIKYKPSGVWLHMNHRGRLALYKNGGSLHYCPKLQAWGSEPAPQGKWWEISNGYLDYGRKPRIKVKEKKEKPFASFQDWKIDDHGRLSIGEKKADANPAKETRSPFKRLAGAEDETGKLPWWAV